MDVVVFEAMPDSMSSSVAGATSSPGSAATASHTSTAPPTTSATSSLPGQTTPSSNPAGLASGQPTSPSATVAPVASQPTSSPVAVAPGAGQSTSSSNPVPPVLGQPTSSTSPVQSGPPSQISSSKGTSSAVLNATANAQQSNDHHLSDGAVAGVVIGVGVGLALATFLVTFLFMRSRRRSRARRRRRSVAGGRGSIDTGTAHEGDTDMELNHPVLTEQNLAARGTSSLESYLPQSADDEAVKIKVATLFEQVQLHVENFYQNSTASISEPTAVELTKFDSGELAEPLEISMRRSRSQFPFITHCLTRSIVFSLMPDTDPERSLLPLDLVALPNVIKSVKSAKPRKAGESTSVTKIVSLNRH